MNEKEAVPTDYTMGIVKANILALLLSIPIFLGYSLIYISLHGTDGWGMSMDSIATNFSFFLISLVVGIVLHEFIHGVSWWWLDDISWSHIHFGFKWATLTPYVHCPESIEVTNYRWGVAMPGMMLGIIPFLLALVFQNGWLFGFGLIFTLAAGGDIIMLWMLRQVPDGFMVQDHPDLMGCKVFNSNE